MRGHGLEDVYVVSASSTEALPATVSTPCHQVKHHGQVGMSLEERAGKHTSAARLSFMNNSVIHVDAATQR